MRVGFIGLGEQGKYLAINLARAGYDLIVYDVRPEPLRELAAAGAEVANSARELAARSEIVEICVLNDAQLEDVALRPDGVLQHIARKAVIVSHSTVSPATIARIGAAASDRDVEVVDAPVSGGEIGARNKKMSYMVGGNAEAVARCIPLFETSGSAITLTGRPGSGIRAKLAHQLIISINMLAAYEGMRLGIESGLPPELLEKVVHEGGAQSRVADRWSKRSLSAHTVAVLRKDLELCLKFADEIGVPAPMAALAHQLIERVVSEA